MLQDPYMKFDDFTRSTNSGDSASALQPFLQITLKKGYDKQQAEVSKKLKGMGYTVIGTDRLGTIRCYYVEGTDYTDITKMEEVKSCTKSDNFALRESVSEDGYRLLEDEIGNDFEVEFPDDKHLHIKGGYVKLFLNKKQLTFNNKDWHFALNIEDIISITKRKKDIVVVLNWGTCILRPKPTTESVHTRFESFLETISDNIARYTAVLEQLKEDAKTHKFIVRTNYKRFLPDPMNIIFTDTHMILSENGSDDDFEFTIKLECVESIKKNDETYTIRPVYQTLDSDVYYLTVIK